MNAKRAKDRGEVEAGPIITKGGVVVVSAASAASLLKQKGVLEAAKNMKFVRLSKHGEAAATASEYAARRRDYLKKR